MTLYEKVERVYHGQRVDILSVEVRGSGGKMALREVVDHPGAVVILPLLDPETVLLIRNERYVVQQTLWELPAGTLEPGEEPLNCAARELQEETGYSAQHLDPLLDFFSTPGFSNEILYTFVAQELTYVGQNLDETEVIEVEALPLLTALKMIEEGVIRDAKTISSLLYFYTYRHNKKKSQGHR